MNKKLLLTCVLIGALFVSSCIGCDESESVQKCVDDYDYCISREASTWEEHPEILCPLCIPTFGLCLNSTECYKDTFARYSQICKEEARCTNCLSIPLNSPHLKPNKPLSTSDALKRIVFSLVVASVLLGLAGSFALKFSW